MNEIRINEELTKYKEPVVVLLIYLYPIYSWFYFHQFYLNTYHFYGENEQISTNFPIRILLSI